VPVAQDDRVHVELARALAPVLHDLETTGGPVPQVVDEDWQDDPRWPSAMLRGADGSGMGIRVTAGDPRPQQVAEVADQVQEWAVEELWRNRPTNWPPCPQHPTTHPLAPEVRDGAARWCCPTDGTAVAVVGALG
jgi:hypothetical protein